MKTTDVDVVLDDMRIKSCVAFVGPFADLKTCPECSEPRYDPEKLAQTRKEVPRQQLCTIPLGPQLQALRRSRQGAAALSYRDQKLSQILEEFNTPGSVADRVYNDIYSGSALRKLAEKLGLTKDDIMVSFSVDGAQLYQNKKSDTWIAIFIICDYNPVTRFKKIRVLPGIVIPGPNKPKILDSFLFRSFYHLSALQRENGGRGMSVWDSLQQKILNSQVIFMHGTADAVGLTELDGRVGHHGAQGCRVGCPMKGRHKPGSGHYCAAHLRPNDCSVEDSNHPDYDFRCRPVDPSFETYQINLAKVVASEDQQTYEHNRKLTGISKPSIISGLHSDYTIPVGECFPLDLMHPMLNTGELFIPIWRGTFRCDPTDNKASWDWATLNGDTWIEHGKLVAAATQYFPSSFHRPPRNPAEKISSGFKATEYYLYLFGLGPGVFRAVLPKKYWRNFCKLVHGFRIIIQRSITGRQVLEAHVSLTSFVEEYENLYYQRRMDRLHFCRPCLHTLLHAAPEIIRVGPGAYTTQFTMERAIGDLGHDIRQPSNIFCNLCQVAIRRAQLNALKTTCPELDQDSVILPPNGAYDCGDNLIFLRPRDRYNFRLQGDELNVMDNELGISRLRRWGRIKLPNGQIVRSKFSEMGKRPNTRISRNVKVN